MSRKILTSTITLTIALLVLLTVNLTTLNSPPTLQNSNSDSHTIPTIEISLTGTKLPEILKGTKHIIYPENNLAITTNIQNNNYEHVEFKGRGNTTWREPKKSFSIKFLSKTTLLNLGKMKKWNLLANYLDDSYIRNALAFYIQEITNVQFYPKGDFIELYIDNDYQGLYFLTNAITISKNSVDLRNQFGILVELDNAFYQEGDIVVIADNSDHLVMKDAVEPGNINIATDNFLAKYNTLIEAARTQDFATASQSIDIESFATHFLYETFISNPDAFYTSCFLYQDGPDDKIHVGPGWDFDRSFHNPNTNSLSTHDEKRADNIFILLSKIPEFQNLVQRIYLEKLSPNRDNILAYAQNLYAYIYPTAIRDAEKWSLHKWAPNYPQIPDPPIDVDDKLNTDFDNLIDWLTNRFDYFDTKYASYK